MNKVDKLVKKNRQLNQKLNLKKTLTGQSPDCVELSSNKTTNKYMDKHPGTL